MTRKESYLRVFAIQNRIEELKYQHGWDEKDMSFVPLANNEPLPIHRHTTGTCTTVSDLVWRELTLRSQSIRASF